jgi:catechol 2,3-dioxygenase-like lactoylglutathione lyase family enzyme
MLLATTRGAQPMANLKRVAPELPVLDMDRALDRYSNQLGFDVVFRMPAGDYAAVERDDASLHLFQDASGTHSASSIQIFTDGLDELAAELHGRGAHVTQDVEAKPWGYRDFRVSDPSGNTIKFTEPL